MTELRDRYDVESAWFADQQARYAAFQLSMSRVLIDVLEEWRLAGPDNAARHTIHVIEPSFAIREARARRDWWHEFYAGDPDDEEDQRWHAGRERFFHSEPSPGSARGTMSACRPHR